MTEVNNIPDGDAGSVDETPAVVVAPAGGQAEEEKKETWDSKVAVPEPEPAPAAPEEDEFVHPEGGWGWLVMLASMWCNGSVFGIQNSFGIIFLALIKEFGSENDQDLQFKTCECGWVVVVVVMVAGRAAESPRFLLTTDG